jgi:LysM repeat protein
MRFITFVLVVSLLLAWKATGVAIAASLPAYSCNDSYVVRQGDSLGAIASRCQITFASLLAANPQIHETSIIYPGQVLNILPDARPPAYPNTYMVQPGETLSSIAYKYDTTVKELIRVNPEILDPRFIYVNQVLHLPGDISGPRIGLSADSVKPGWYLEVKVYGFPPNTDIDYRFGKEGGPYTAVVDGLTGPDGSTTGYVTFPYSAKAGDKWEIQVLTTETSNPVQAISSVIVISN